jgi:hypothetical protein
MFNSLILLLVRKFFPSLIITDLGTVSLATSCLKISSISFVISKYSFNPFSNITGEITGLTVGLRRNVAISIDHVRMELSNIQQQDVPEIDVTEKNRSENSFLRLFQSLIQINRIMVNMFEIAIVKRHQTIKKLVLCGDTFVAHSMAVDSSLSLEITNLSVAATFQQSTNFSKPDIKVFNVAIQVPDLNAFYSNLPTQLLIRVESIVFQSSIDFIKECVDIISTPRDNVDNTARVTHESEIGIISSLRYFLRGLKQYMLHTLNKAEVRRESELSSESSSSFETAKSEFSEDEVAFSLHQDTATSISTTSIHLKVTSVDMKLAERRADLDASEMKWHRSINATDILVVHTSDGTFSISTSRCHFVSTSVDVTATNFHLPLTSSFPLLAFLSSSILEFNVCFKVDEVEVKIYSQKSKTGTDALEKILNNFSNKSLKLAGIIEIGNFNVALFDQDKIQHWQSTYVDKHCLIQFSINTLEKYMQACFSNSVSCWYKLPPDLYPYEIEAIVSNISFEYRAHDRKSITIKKLQITHALENIGVVNVALDGVTYMRNMGDQARNFRVNRVSVLAKHLKASLLSLSLTNLKVSNRQRGSNIGSSLLRLQLSDDGAIYILSHFTSICKWIASLFSSFSPTSAASTLVSKRYRHRDVLRESLFLQYALYTEGDESGGSDTFYQFIDKRTFHLQLKEDETFNRVFLDKIELKVEKNVDDSIIFLAVDCSNCAAGVSIKSEMLDMVKFSLEEITVFVGKRKLSVISSVNKLVTPKEKGNYWFVFEYASQSLPLPLHSVAISTSPLVISVDLSTIKLLQILLQSFELVASSQTSRDVGKLAYPLKLLIHSMSIVFTYITDYSPELSTSFNETQRNVFSSTPFQIPISNANLFFSSIDRTYQMSSLQTIFSEVVDEYTSQLWQRSLHRLLLGAIPFSQSFVWSKTQIQEAIMNRLHDEGAIERRVLDLIYGIKLS